MNQSGPSDERRSAPDDPDASTRSRASDAISTVIDGTSFVAGPDFFKALVRQLAQALQVSYAFVAECTDDSKTRVRTLAFWSRDRLVDNIEWELSGTPCEPVIGGSQGYHARDLQSKFPDDRGLVDLGADSYLGIPLVDAAGEVLGHLAVMDVKPM